MKVLSRRLFLLVSLSFCVSAGAFEPTFTALFSDQAIRGYDTVAYFTQGKPVQGNEKFTTEYNQATWLFSSQENLDLFLTNPEKYSPQYGGYCAYAVAHNKTASVQPELFAIVEDKLYLNYSQSINQKWAADKQKLIEAADKNWPKLLAD